MGDYCGFSSNLAWRWSLNVLLSCMGGVSLWERCVLPPCAAPVLLGGSGAHTQLSLRHRRVLHPPSSQEPVLPTASFVGLFFSSYQLFSCVFFLPSCSHTCTKYCLFLILLLLFSLPPDLYFYLILILILFPGSWAEG